MKKVIWIFLFFVKNIIPTDYPIAGNDRRVNAFVTAATSTFNAGDTISVGNPLDDTGYQGLCWLKTRLDTNATGSGYIKVSTPLPVYTGLYLSDWNVLDIHKDLFLSADCQLRRSGKISCGAETRSESALILLGSFNLNDKTLTFTNSESTIDQPAFIDGNGNVIDFSNGGQITFDTGPRGELKIRNAVLKNVGQNGINIATGSLALDNVTLELRESIPFMNSGATLNLYGDVVVTGSYVFTIGGSCNFYNDAKLYIDKGVTFNIGSGANFNFYGTKTGGIHFNGCNIYIANNDLILNEGSIFFENGIRVIDNNSYNAIVIGSNCNAQCLATARISLETAATFSVL